jgi:hypothetical protein
VAATGRQLAFFGARIVAAALAFDSKTSCGANETVAGTGDPFFREAVSAQRPVFLIGAAALPLPRSLVRVRR